MADQQDVVSVLTHDHREVEELFNQIERSADLGVRRDLTDQAITELVRHSVAEEQYLYPAVHATVEELRSLGAKVEMAKKMAPTRPHPSAPDTPPLNKIVGPGVGLVDRARDKLSGRTPMGSWGRHGADGGL